MRIRTHSETIAGGDGQIQKSFATGSRLCVPPRPVAHLLWAHTHGLVTLHLAGKLGMGRSLEELADAPVPAFASTGE